MKRNKQYKSSTRILIFYIICFFFLCSMILLGQNQTNQLEIEFKSVNKVLRIIADSSTYDKKFGDSYRVLLVLKKENENDLKQINRIVLPVNGSPDYAYRLTEKFDRECKFILIQGFRHLFIYNVLTDSLSKIISPTFKNAVGVDAQTGYLKDIRITENGKYLTGYAMDLGEFRFDLSNLMEPRQIH